LSWSRCFPSPSFRVDTTNVRLLAAHLALPTLAALAAMLHRGFDATTTVDDEQHAIPCVTGIATAHHECNVDAERCRTDPQPWPTWRAQLHLPETADMAAQ
jgi:hypothetical protein